MSKNLVGLLVILLTSWIAFSSRDTHAQGSEVDSMEMIQLPKWRASMISEDLIWLDFLEVEVDSLNKIIVEQKLTIVDRDSAIAIRQRTIDRQEKAYTLLSVRELKAEQQAIELSFTARKYKRQRNWTRAGALGLITYILVKGLKG